MKSILLCAFYICILGQDLPAEQVHEKARVTANGGLILRAEPLKSSARILTIPFKSIIDILEVGPIDKGAERDYWFKAKHQGKTGWVYGAYIDFDIAERPVMHTVRGTFKRIDAGDYLHLVMDNDSGKEINFWLYRRIENFDLDRIEANQSEYAGRPISVTWRESVTFLPEAGTIERIQMVVKIQFLNK